jgi:hypothetical protein
MRKNEKLPKNKREHVIYAGFTIISVIITDFCERIGESAAIFDGAGRGSFGDDDIEMVRTRREETA